MEIAIDLVAKEKSSFSQWHFSSGFSNNPSHSAPCTVTLDIFMLCVVTTHREPEIRYIILASVYMVSHSYVVGLYLIPNSSVFVSHIIIKLHVCHLP